MSKKTSKSKTSKTSNGQHIYLTLNELASLSQIPLATLEKASRSNDKATSLYSYKRSDGTTMSHPVCVLRWTRKTDFIALSDKGRNALLKVCERTDWGKRYLANVNRKSVAVQVKAQTKKEKKVAAAPAIVASKTTNGKAIPASK